MNRSTATRRGEAIVVLSPVLLSALLSGCRGRGKTVATASLPAAPAAGPDEDDKALITEAPGANPKDPFQSQAKVALAAVPGAPGTPPVSPKGPEHITVPPAIEAGKSGSAPPPPAPAAKPEPKGDGGGHSAPAPSAPSGPQMPDAATLKKLDPQSPPDWTDAPQAADGKLVLLGVVEGQRPQAVFSDDGKVVRKRVGDEVAGLRVVSISHRQVLLRDTESGTKAYWLSVKSGSRLGGTHSSPAKTTEPKPSSDGGSETSKDGGKDSGSGEGSKPEESSSDGGDSKAK